MEKVPVYENIGIRVDGVLVKYCKRRFFRKEGDMCCERPVFSKNPAREFAAYRLHMAFANSRLFHSSQENLCLQFLTRSSGFDSEVQW